MLSKLDPEVRWIHSHKDSNWLFYFWCDGSAEIERLRALIESCENHGLTYRASFPVKADFPNPGIL